MLRNALLASVFTLGTRISAAATIQIDTDSDAVYIDGLLAAPCRTLPCCRWRA